MYNSPDTISSPEIDVGNPSKPVDDQEGSVPLNPITEKWHKTPKARGRQPKDPDAQVVRFDCHDADDMETYLSDYLNAPTAPAEHATIEFHFPPTAAFMVYSKDFKKDHPKPPPGVDANVYEALKRTAVSVMEVLGPAETPKDQIRRQKAVAKICVQTLQKADGFRYSFHNSWLSREDEAYRFSFFCNDSTLNKGRAANGATAAKTKRKAVYDCQGLISVKLSVTKQNLEVHYRHIPMHKTYAERAPPPRRDSKRRKLMELFDPESLPPTRGTTQRKKTDEHQHKRRVSTADSIIDVPRQSEGSLQPLIDFLGSAERQGSSTSIPSILAKDIPSQSDSVIKRKKNAVPPGIPGAMFGNIRSGSISWTSTETTTQGQHGKDSQMLKNKKSSKKSIEDRPAPALSEIEMLKQKLLEAEERIKRLESQPQPPSHPHQPGYPPHPWGYPPLPHYPLPPMPSQYRHPHPTHPVQFNSTPQSQGRGQPHGMTGVLKPPTVSASNTQTGSKGRGSFISWQPKETGRGRGKDTTNVGISAETRDMNDIPSKFL